MGRFATLRQTYHLKYFSRQILEAIRANGPNPVVREGVSPLPYPTLPSLGDMHNAQTVRPIPNAHTTTIRPCRHCTYSKHTVQNKTKIHKKTASSKFPV